MVGCKGCKHLKETGEKPKGHYIAYGLVNEYKCELEHPLVWEFENLFHDNDTSIKCKDDTKNENNS